MKVLVTVIGRQSSSSEAMKCGDDGVATEKKTVEKKYRFHQDRELELQLLSLLLLIDFLIDFLLIDWWQDRPQ